MSNETLSDRLSGIQKGILLTIDVHPSEGMRGGDIARCNAISSNAIGSRLTTLVDEGLIYMPEDRWRLTDTGRKWVAAYRKGDVR
jgi:predicted transcriptional regulator